MKKLISIFIICTLLFTMSITTFAAGSGTLEDPFIGESDLGDAFDGNITIHKYDISAWEALINGENRPAAAAASYIIKYFGNKAAGTSIAESGQVGYYYLNSSDEAAKANEQPVFLSELKKVSNITFRIQSAEPKSDKDGSSKVADYNVISGVDSYGKTSDGIMVWRGVPKGYYIVTEIENDTTQEVIPPFVITMPMFETSDIQTPSENKDIHIYPKNALTDGPKIIKEPVTSSLENGNKLSWKVTSDVPDGIAAAIKFTITDIMSKGLDYAGNLKVFYGTNTELTMNTDYSVNTATLADGRTQLTIELTTAGKQKLGTGNVDKLYATYDTIINLSAEDWKELEKNAIDNEIHLQFINKDGSDYESKPPKVEIDATGLRIKKVDGATDKGLTGVKFKLYTKLNLAGDAVDTSSALKDKSGSEITLVTDSDGIAAYYGLLPGDYYLVETETVEGYKMLTGFKQLTITASMAENQTVLETKIENLLDNTITLPETGDRGAIMFTIYGILLLLSAGVVFTLFHRKKEK